MNSSSLDSKENVRFPPKEGGWVIRKLFFLSLYWSCFFFFLNIYSHNLNHAKRQIWNMSSDKARSTYSSIIYKLCGLRRCIYVNLGFFPLRIGKNNEWISWMVFVRFYIWIYLSSSDIIQNSRFLSPTTFLRLTPSCLIDISKQHFQSWIQCFPYLVLPIILLISVLGNRISPVLLPQNLEVTIEQSILNPTIYI